jgi:hypothetical protein
MEYYQRTSKVLLDSLNFKALIVSHINYLFRLTMLRISLVKQPATAAL